MWEEEEKARRRKEGKWVCHCASSHNLGSPRASGWRRVVEHASKPHFRKLAKALTALSVLPKYLHTPNTQPLRKCESVGQWEELSPQVCPSYCAAPPPARAAALLQPARHHTTLPFEQHTADSFSRSKFQLRRPFLPPADAGRPTTRGLNSCGTNMT